MNAVTMLVDSGSDRMLTMAPGEVVERIKTTAIACTAKLTVRALASSSSNTAPARAPRVAAVRGRAR